MALKENNDGGGRRNVAASDDGQPIIAPLIPAFQRWTTTTAAPALYGTRSNHEADDEVRLVPCCDDHDDDMQVDHDDDDNTADDGDDDDDDDDDDDNKENNAAPIHQSMFVVSLESNICAVRIRGHARCKVLFNRFHALRRAPLVRTDNDCVVAFFAVSLAAKSLNYGFTCSKGCAGTSFLTRCDLVLPTEPSLWSNLDETEALDTVPDLLLGLICPSPAHAPTTRVHLADGTMEVELCATTMCMRNLSPFRDVNLRDSDVPTPEPAEEEGQQQRFAMAHMLQLQHTIKHGFVGSLRAPEFYATMLKLADALGVDDKDDQGSFLRRHLEQMTRFAKEDPEWLHGIISDRYAVLCSDPPPVIHVDALPCSSLITRRRSLSSVRQNDFRDWLFPTIMEAAEAVTGAGAVERESSWLRVEDVHRVALHLESKLPASVSSLMRMFPGEVVLTGGWVLGEVVRGVKPGRELVVFFVASDAKRTRFLGNWAVDHMKDSITPRFEWVRRMSSSSSANIAILGSRGLEVHVVMTKSFSSLSDVLHSIDVPAAQMGLVFAKNESTKSALSYTPRLYATPACVDCARRMSAWVDKTMWEGCSMWSFIKYFAKGFGIFAPAVKDGHENESALQVQGDAIQALSDRLSTACAAGRARVISSGLSSPSSSSSFAAFPSSSIPIVEKAIMQGLTERDRSGTMPKSLVNVLQALAVWEMS